MPAPPKDPLSRVRFGALEVCRLILGHNPLCGNSHLSAERDTEMRAYYNTETVVKLYQHAEQLGLRTLLIRGDYRMLEWVEQYRRRGGTMDLISQTASEMHDVFSNIRVLAAAGVKAVYHHGSRTDQFWQNGCIDKTRDYLKCMRDCGVAVGLASHMPEVFEYVEERGWDVDFYMTSFYNLSRKPRESSIVTGKAAYADEEYLPEDRAKMVRLIQSVKKPCLAFKILAASRNCATQEDVRTAFRFAYTNIKPTDAVVVGLFQRDQDQLALDLQYAAEVCG
jgi:hypothetical protein